jgi:undecaprenyl-diphosphatase
LVTTFDARALLWFYGGAHGAWGTLMLGVTLLGEGWTALLLLPLLWSSRTRIFAAALTAAVVAQSVAVWAMKATVGRVRPWIAFGLPPPFGSPHDGSFPSGHAAGSFCVAAFLAVALPAVWPAPRARVVSAAGFVLASLIAASRVYLGAHFPTDVLAGAVLGAAAGALAATHYVTRLGAVGVERASKKR